MISQVKFKMPEKRYVVCPDFVTSKSDFQEYWISAGTLLKLYGVPSYLCEIAPYSYYADVNLGRFKPTGYEEPRDLIPLRPRWAGDYAEHLAKMEATWDTYDEEEDEDEDEDEEDSEMIFDEEELCQAGNNCANKKYATRYGEWMRNAARLVRRNYGYDE